MQERKEQPLINLPIRNRLISCKKNVYNLMSNAVRIYVVRQSLPLHICILKMHTLPQYSKICCKSEIRDYIEAKLKATFRQFIRPSDSIIITTDRYEVEKKMLKLVFGNLPIELWMQKICSFDFCTKSNSYQTLKFINSIINNILKNNKYSSNNKNTFFFKPILNTLLLPNIFKIEGFSTSLRYSKNDFFLFLKDSKKYVNSKTVLQEINQFYYENKEMQKWQRRMQLNQIFKNTQIMCQYGSNKIYIFQTFVFDVNIDSISVYKDKKIGLKSYYYDKYKLRIENCNQPLIRVRGWKNSFFIPEFMCRILKNKELKDMQEKSNVRLSSQTLEIQYQKTCQILQMLKSKAAFPTFFNYRQMNLSIQQNLIKLKGIALQYPTIRTGKNQIVDIFQGRNFQFENKSVFQCEKDLNICIICPTALDINNLKKDIIIVTEQIGVNHNIVVYTYGLVNSEQLLETIKQMIYIQKEMKRRFQSNIYWIFLSKQYKRIYGSLKRIVLDETIDEMTQITMLDTLQSKQRKKIISSIIQQMVAKIQGKLWIIENKFRNKNILMIGLYSKLMQYRQTILSICFNKDPLISQFSSRFYIHHNGFNISQYIRTVVMQAIQLYLYTSKSFPEDIIILRNEYEINELQQYKEIDEILEGVKSYYLFKPNKPGISYLTVKSIKNLKISLIKSDSFSRPFHGLLISTEIVTKDDFILGNEFTSSNSYVYYRKLYNKTSISFDQLAEFLYHQTFNYYNFQGGISIPAVLKYAQKQANFLAKLENVTQLDQTSNFLYFL